MSQTRRLIAVLLTVLLALGLVACGGEKKATSGKTPAQVLELAKKNIDDTSGIAFDLSTTDQPKGGNGILSATGVVTKEPAAFKGEAKVLFSGLSATVPIVSVDGKVYANLPMTGGFSVVDPADYAFPDPAGFMDTTSGLSSLLTKVTDPKKGDETRDGKQILTTYSGVLKGADVKKIIPSADGGADYPTVFGIDQDGKVRTVDVTGDFFGDGSDVTYTIGFSKYDVTEKIKAPATS